MSLSRLVRVPPPLIVGALLPALPLAQSGSSVITGIVKEGSQGQCSLAQASAFESSWSSCLRGVFL